MKVIVHNSLQVLFYVYMWLNQQNEFSTKTGHLKLGMNRCMSDGNKSIANVLTVLFQYWFYFTPSMSVI